MHAAPPVQPVFHPIERSIRVTVVGPAHASALDNAAGRQAGGSSYRGFAWRDLGTPFYGRGYFETILDRIPDSNRMFVRRPRGKTIATAHCGYGGSRVEGLWNDGLPEARAQQANYVAYREMIQRGCRSGQSYFHFGRATADSGSEKYKRTWNAGKHQFSLYCWSPAGGRAPELNLRNPGYPLASTAWQRLPFVATRFIGPRLARGIP